MKLKEGKTYLVHGMGTRYIRIEKIFEANTGCFFKRLNTIVRYAHDTGDRGSYFVDKIWGDMKYGDLLEHIIDVKE